VQLAKSFGAHVTGVCSPTNLELVQSLGADQVIDYTQEDFTQGGQAYDIILDTVGNTSFSRCNGLLKHGGVYLSTVLRLSTLLQTIWTSRFGSKRAVFMSTGMRPARAKA
jgi:NADPH:quinone reductase-like Zn-dependent oxidoreductase